MARHDRKTEDINRLAKWVDSPQTDGLLSYTERIMVALATNDQTRAPGSLRDDPEWTTRAIAGLDGAQRAVLVGYRNSGPVGQAEALLREIRERIAELDQLDGLPDPERRRYLKAIIATINVQYLTTSDQYQERG